MLISFLSSAQTKVYPLSEASSKVFKGSSFIYMLPTTSLKVTVTELKITDVEGYYSNYAESLLGISNIVKKNRTYYVLEKVDVEAITIPDEHNAFAVDCKSFASVEDFFKGKPQNICHNKATATVYKKSSADLPDFFKNYADISYTHQSSAFVDTKIIDGVVTQVPASHTKVVSKSNAQKAQQAADAIAKSRQDQYNLVAGEQETPYSGDAIKEMISELKQWENNYLSLFTGVSVVDTVQHTFYVTPSSDQTNIQIFSFNEDKGFSENLTSKEVYSLNFSQLCNTKNIGVAAQDLKSNFDNYSMFRYKKTAPITIELLKNGGKIYNLNTFDMYQFGETKTFSVNEKPIGVDFVGFIY